MSGRELRDRLRDAALPGEDESRERARGAVTEAYARRRRAAPRIPRPAIAALTILAAGAAALTPAGADVRGWLGDVVAPSEPAPRQAFGPLPGGGRLLVVSPGGAWVVAPDGARRRLGPYDDATWSPRGLFVAVARDRQLLAVEPGGSVRWGLTRPEPVTHPRWEPVDGFRVAYRDGAALRVVAGDGSSDRLLDRAAEPAAPAWLPRRGHRLAYIDQGRVVRLVRADGGRRIWSRRVPGARALAWSADGTVLFVESAGALHLLDARGRPVGTRRLAAGALLDTAVPAPAGRRVATVTYDPRRRTSTLAVLRPGETEGTTVFSAAGRFGDVVWSPDGRHLLLARPDAGQWLFLPVARPGRVVVTDGIAAQFDPRSQRTRGFPALAGWCCSR